MRPAGHRKMPVVVGGNGHPPKLRADRRGSGGREGSRVDERGSPCAGEMTLRAVLGERRRRRRAAVARMDTGVQVVGRVACEAVGLDRSPLPLAIALMTLGAVGERMHPGERESRPSMDLERLHVVPTSRRMTACAATAQTRLMRVSMAAFALARDPLLATVTLVACGGCVAPRERKAGSRVVEPFAGLRARHMPARGGVAIAAVQALGD